MKNSRKVLGIDIKLPTINYSFIKLSQGKVFQMSSIYQRRIYSRRYLVELRRDLWKFNWN